MLKLYCDGTELRFPVYLSPVMVFLVVHEVEPPEIFSARAAFVFFYYL